MTKKFTAEELFDYIRSFSELFIWEGPSGDNGLYLDIEASKLNILKRKNTYAISAEITERGMKYYQKGGFCIDGNEFLCDIEQNNGPIKMTVRSENGERLMKINLVT